jgi:hypothetical protein
VAANIRTIKERLREKGAEVYSLNYHGQRQLGIFDRADLHVESPPFDPVYRHLNAAGYAFVVRRTLPEIEALVRKVEKRR